MAGALKMRVKWVATPDQVRGAFAQLEAGLRDWSPAMARIRSVLGAMFRGIFSSRGADLDGAWAPPAVETVRRRLRAGGASSEASLRATGVLEGSLTADTGDGSIRRVVQPGQGVPRIEWGTRLPYAAAIQFGSSKRGIPARPFVGITADAQEEIREVLQEQLARRLDETAAALGRKA